MGMAEQQTVAHLAQTVAQVASDPGVSWEVFKWTLGIVITIGLAYTTGCYGLLWKVFLLTKQGRDKLWDAIEAIKTNELKHMQDEIDALKGKR